MRKQDGVTLSGFILWSIAAIVALLLAFKLFPAYYEYYQIKRTFTVIVKDETLRSLTKRDVESSFVRRATIENIQVLGPQDLTITRENQAWVIEAQYTVCVPIFGNLSACMDFAPQSDRI